MILTVIIFVITLLVLVVIHELGHFLTAKKFGIKVEEFGFGLPPRAWGKKVGDTLVSINWLPFGGFVRLLGEDDVAPKSIKDKSGYFSERPAWQRFMVVIAGVVMNLLLAWVIFYITLGFQGFKTQFPLIVDHNFFGAKQTNENLIVVRDVAKDSPAFLAGLQSGDRIVAANNQEITSSNDFIDLTKEFAGKPYNLTITDLQKQNPRQVTLTPRQNPPEGEGPLGVSLNQAKIASIEYEQPWQKLLAGPIHSINLTVYSGKILGSFIEQSIKTKDIGPVSQTVAGPIGITSLVNSILTENKNPLLPYLEFVGLLSLNLAVMNVLPIPALDGGRLFFILVEWITRKKVHADFERWVHTVGMVILLSIMLLVTFADIKKLLP
jgi:regulator of sigma E protease